jgi:putative membrane protein
VLGTADPLTLPLTPHPRAALRRRLIRALFSAVFLIAVSAVLAWAFDDPSWVVATAIVTVPLGVLLGIDRYRSLGHAVADGRVVFRLGSLVRRRSVLVADGVIGFTVRQTFFQRRNGLVSLTATTAAGRQRYELLDVSEGRAVEIANEIMPGVVSEFVRPVELSGTV